MAYNVNQNETLDPRFDSAAGPSRVLGPNEETGQARRGDARGHHQGVDIELSRELSLPRTIQIELVEDAALDTSLFSGPSRSERNNLSTKYALGSTAAADVEVSEAARTDASPTMFAVVDKRNVTRGPTRHPTRGIH